MNYLSPSVHQDDYSDGHRIYSPHLYNFITLSQYDHTEDHVSTCGLLRGTHAPNSQTTARQCQKVRSYLFALMFLVRLCFGGRVGSFSFLNTKIDFLMSYLYVITRSQFLLAFFFKPHKQQERQKNGLGKAKAMEKCL